MYSYPLSPISSSNLKRWGLCFRGVLFSIIGVVGDYGSVEYSFRCKQGRALVIVPPGAYRPKAQMVAPPGAGGVKAEALVVR